LTVDQDKKQILVNASVEETKEKEIALDEIFSKTPEGTENASLVLDENINRFRVTAYSEKAKEKEISLDEITYENPDGIEDSSLVLDEKNESFHHTATSDVLLDKELSKFEASLASPDKQDEVAAEKFSIAPNTAPIQPAKQATTILSSPLPVKKAEKPKTASDASQIYKPINKVIAVGGAKGGVGKSMLSANIAVGLALLGHKVVIADLDLGGADVHLYTGIKSLDKTWGDFLDKKVESIKDILTPTAFKGLSLVGGDSTRLGSANLPYLQKLKIMRHLKALETDFLVIDLGGDTSYNVLDFFLMADQKIVVSGSEPASILDSYAFVKVAINRFLERLFSKHKLLKDLAVQIKNASFEKSKNYSLDFIFQEVRTRDPLASIELKNQFDKFRLSIVLNMAESRNDVRIAESMQKLVKDKCFLDIGILGTIPFDKVVRKAARCFTPIVVENPKCQASRNIHQMLAAIIFHSEQEINRAELLNSTSRIRREAKKQIDSGKMTIDGLTFGQINSIFNNTPRLRQSFQKILNIMSN
jgi:flagellar biosynthesis protein FlhG